LGQRNIANQGHLTILFVSDSYLRPAADQLIISQ